ncbi:uncharacterized protein LOC127806761 [Diospyros lotus]|uniref:uncharacterized protein LOC127806761 n=1 Tax=Diospyros lotus TaxID=55363 RepID=UPI00225975F9|nr:uncharacterized protein LOC127806761 [Diospyros lotus]
MERKGLVICSVVAFLGLLSAVLGFAAEAKRIRASQVQFLSSTTCEYPSGSSPAVGLGVAAAMALLLAQIIISVMSGCICCCRRGPHQSNPNWPVALICFIVSWFTFVVAFLLLLTAAALNDQRGEESMDMSVYYCYVVKPGVFTGAALLALASVGLGIFYYVTLKSTKNNNAPGCCCWWSCS